MRITRALLLAASILTSGIVFAGVDEGLEALKNADYKTAMKEFSSLAEKGDTKAMTQVGLFYYEGKGVKQDYPKAMDWFLKAFSNQNADAFVNIGVMCRDGQGVKANKKMAYCIFLTTHMCSLGSESTQIRANSCLRRIMDELPKEEIKDCLSNYTLPYMTAYIEARGNLDGIPDKYKPSKEQPALKDLDWWLDGELDGIYGPPTEEEKKARKEKTEQRQKEYETLKHTLVIQLKSSGSLEKQYRSIDFITDGSMGSLSFSTNKTANTDNAIVFEADETISINHKRCISIEDKDRNYTLIYEIQHPDKPSPCDWSAWMKPAYSLKDSMETFTLCNGREPKNKIKNIPANAPEIRFKVIKK